MRRGRGGQTNKRWKKNNDVYRHAYQPKRRWDETYEWPCSVVTSPFTVSETAGKTGDALLMLDNHVHGLLLATREVYTVSLRHRLPLPKSWEFGRV